MTFFVVISYLDKKFLLVGAKIPTTMKTRSAPSFSTYLKLRNLPFIHIHISGKRSQKANFFADVRRIYKWIRRSSYTLLKKTSLPYSAPRSELKLWKVVRGQQPVVALEADRSGGQETWAENPISGRIDGGWRMGGYSEYDQSSKIQKLYFCYIHICKMIILSIENSKFIYK